MDNTKKLHHISLCTGYGGIDLGLKYALPCVRTIAYCEIEAFAVANLVKNIEKGLLECAPVWSDIKSFPYTQFDKIVDILSAGFPCQPFTVLGRRKSDADARHLWPYIYSGIQQSSPSIVFLENVAGIATAKLKGTDWSDPQNTPVLLHVIREMERLGFKTTASLFSAREAGAPHYRKRYFILAVHKDAHTELIKYIDSNLTTTNSRYRFPAHKNQQQYSWEPPRVLEDTRSTGLYRGPRKDKVLEEEGDVDPRNTRGRGISRSSKHSMDRDSNGVAPVLGFSDPLVDEIRLLGNGVVPQTAEIAFKHLWRKYQNGDVI